MPIFDKISFFFRPKLYMVHSRQERCGDLYKWVCLSTNTDHAPLLLSNHRHCRNVHWSNASVIILMCVELELYF